MGPNDVGLVNDKGDTLPSRTARRDAGSMAGGSDGPITDARSGSDVVAHNTSFVRSSPYHLVPNLTPVLLLGRSTFSTGELRRYTRIGAQPRCGGDGKTNRRDGF